jgi:hypothetical protein
MRARVLRVLMGGGVFLGGVPPVLIPIRGALFKPPSTYYIFGILTFGNIFFIVGGIDRRYTALAVGRGGEHRGSPIPLPRSSHPVQL